MRTLLFLIFSLPLATQAAVTAFEVGPGNTDQLPEGKEADGIIGDFILRNEHVTAVISGNQPLRRANMSTFYGTGGITPGCLYDLTLNKRQNDQLTIFAPGSQRGDISHIRITQAGGFGADAVAEIEVVVAAERNKGLYKKHVYRLDSMSRGLLITTTYRNDSKETRRGSVDDYWKPSGKRGTFQGVRWIDAVDPADRGSYAAVWVNGQRRSGIASNPGSLSLKAGETATYTRFLAVANSPAAAVSEALVYASASNKLLVGHLKDPAGQPVNDATFEIRSGNETLPGYPLGQGKFAVHLPAGEYGVRITDRGRTTIDRKVSLQGNQATVLSETLTALSGVALNITDAGGHSIPCKVQFSGLNGTETPNLGPQNRAHGCVDQWHSETGKFNVALDPGTYRLVITRGIEHNHLVREVTVKAGEFAAVTGSLKRLVNTAGWVSTDFHNHSTPSGDNQCGTDDRLINLAAEHIEFAPTTEHNRLYDWTPHIQKLGLTQHLRTIVGLELTGGGAGSHHNAFPLPTPNPYAQDGGAPVFQVDPRLNAIALQNHGGWDPDRWVHINHPNLTEKFWDRNLDGKADGGFKGYEKYINALESQNFRGNDILSTVPWKLYRRGTSESVREVREFIWLQMLNQGYRTRAIAVADAHSVYGNGVGGWRTYIPSSTDEPAKIDPDEIIRNAKAGRLMLTTGPFLEVTANGALPGSDITAKDGKVNLKVKIQCTDWVHINRVQVLVNGRQDPNLNITAEKNPRMFKKTPTVFETTFSLDLKEDTHLIVVAMGENADLKTGYGTSTNASLKPCAYINPIWVDTDGNGFQPNKDTLDWPLPLGRQDPAKIRALLKAKGN